MARALILLGVGCLAGAILLLLVLLRHDDAPRAPALPDAGRPDAAGREAVPAPSAAALFGPDAPAASAPAVPQRPLVPAREREQAIRARLVDVLRAYPEVKTTDIRCVDDHHCRVELETTDLTRGGAALERLSAPEGGFAAEARQMRLEAPTGLAQDTGPWRMGFSLEY